MELVVQAENDTDVKSVKRKHLTVSLLNYIQSSGAQAFDEFDPCSMQKVRLCAETRKTNTKQ